MARSGWCRWPRAARGRTGLCSTRRHPWFNLFGTNKLATLDPATMQVTEITLPQERARDRRIAVTSDGKVWYVDYTGGYLGRYDPTTQQFKE